MGGKKKKTTPKQQTNEPAALKPKCLSDADAAVLRDAAEIVRKMKAAGEGSGQTSAGITTGHNTVKTGNNENVEGLIQQLAEAIDGGAATAQKQKQKPQLATFACTAEPVGHPNDALSLSPARLPLWSPSYDDGEGQHTPNPSFSGNLPPKRNGTRSRAGSTVSAKTDTNNKQKKQKEGGRSRSNSGAAGRSLSMSFSNAVYETIGPKAVAKASKVKRNWVIVGLLIIIAGLVYHQKPAMPAGLVVDDPNRPGVLFDEKTIKVRRPVAMIPGFVTSALELWENDECAAPIGGPAAGGTLFRERMFGPQMLFNLLKRPQCYLKQFGLHPQRFGDDPEPADPSSGRRIRARPAGWLDSGDYFVAGFWVWAKLIRSLADIGYDPNIMLLFPFDWRLSSGLAERRDGYFHRLRASLEEMYRIANNTKIVIVSHSYGGVIKRDFFHWCEAREAGWTDKHVHASVFIGAPMLGVTKALSAIVSGEMRDMTQLPAVPRHIFNAYLPRMWRTEAFRSWPCLEAMLPRGCDAMWPNVMSLFNQSITLRASDSFELIETIAEQAGHTGLANTVRESKKSMSALPNLPIAPNMKAFVFYGTGLATESGYAYTLDAGDVGGADAASTARMGRLAIGVPDVAEFLKLFRFGHNPFGSADDAAASSAVAADDHHSSASSAASSRFAADGLGGASSHHKYRFSGNTKSVFDNRSAVYAPPSYAKIAAEAALEGKGGVDYGDAFAAVGRAATAEAIDGVRSDSTVTQTTTAPAAASSSTAADEVLLTWAEYVASLGKMVRNITGKIIDDGVGAIRKTLGDGEAEGESEANAEEAAAGDQQKYGDGKTMDPSSSAKRRYPKLGRRTVLAMPPGSLWRPAFLGARTSGNALMVDTEVSDRVTDRLQSLYSCAPTTSSSSSASGTATSESAVFSSPAPSADCNPLTNRRGGGDMRYHQGVMLGPGDATVPLMSLGFMARSPRGFSSTVGKVVTKEFVHLHTAEAHQRLLAVKAERLRRQREGEWPDDEHTATADEDTTNANSKEGAKKNKSSKKDMKKIRKPRLPDIGITTQRVAAESVLPAKKRRQTTASSASASGAASSLAHHGLVANAAATASAAASEPDDVGLFAAYYDRLSALNVSRLFELDASELEEIFRGASTSFGAATDVIVDHVRENVAAVLDVRGGRASADHVDLMGNYELIGDILNIATGNEDKVGERIFTDIDERVADLPCYK